MSFTQLVLTLACVGAIAGGQVIAFVIVPVLGAAFLGEAFDWRHLAGGVPFPFAGARR
jgi:hypothetical protein